MFGANDLDTLPHITWPLDAPIMNRSTESLGFIHGSDNEKFQADGDGVGLLPARQEPFTKWTLRSPRNSDSSRRKSFREKPLKLHYSVFPTKCRPPRRSSTAAPQIAVLPATVYTPPPTSATFPTKSPTQAGHPGDEPVLANNTVDETFYPPQPLFSRAPHRREESTHSSATVQIGLRLSMMPLTIAALAPAATRRSSLNSANDFPPIADVLSRFPDNEPLPDRPLPLFDLQYGKQHSQPEIGTREITASAS